MKFFTFLSIVLLASTIIIKAQIPNADFENWGDNGPTGWTVDNMPPMIMPVTQTTDAESGVNAVKGEVVSLQGNNIAPFLVSGDTTGYGGFAVSQRYASLKGWYKFAPVQDDSLVIAIVMLKNSQVIGGGVVEPGNASTYTQFTANITYTSGDAPDSARIMISIINHAGELSVHAGSVMYVDNLSFGNVTAVNNGVSQPNSFKLFQNYPNPFNPSTNIKYNLSSSGFVRLAIYNVLGQKVKTLVNKIQNAGEKEVTADLSLFTSGVYFYRLNVRSKNGMHFSSIKKMILLK